MKRSAICTSVVLSIGLWACGGKDAGSSGGGGPPPSAVTTTVNFSTYLGSDSGDFVRDVVVDAAGNVYATGGTGSTDLPTTGGSLQPAIAGSEDAFVVKFDPRGRILWSTYLGGASLDRAYAIELDPQGNVVLGGRAGAGFPVTPGAVQTQFVGGIANALYPPQDGFVAKISADGSRLLWATYFGAYDNDGNIVRDVAVDPSTGAIYLAASTNTADMGTFTTAVAAAFTRGAISSLIGGGDGVLAKLSPDGAQLDWATFVGGSASELGAPSVRVDSQGDAIVAYGSRSTDAATTAGAYDRTQNGVSDFYVAKYAPNGAFLRATYVGGSDAEAFETHNLAVRPDRTVVIAATSLSSNFPTTPGAFDRTHNGNGGNGTGASSNYPGDCVIAILDPDLSQLIAGTYYGGRYGEACEGVGSDGQGNVYVAGGTYSDDIPTSLDAYQTQRPAVIAPFTAVFSRDLAKLRYGTYFGGSGGSTARTIAVHGERHFVFGGSMGAGYPLKNAARSNVSAGNDHGGVTDLTVVLGPG